MSEEKAKEKGFLDKVKNYQLPPILSIGGLAGITFFVLTHIFNGYKSIDDISDRLLELEKTSVKQSDLSDKSLNLENCVELYKQLRELEATMNLEKEEKIVPTEKPPGQ